MRWFKITNLERYQHYSHRSPPWIKLHQSFIDDYDMCRLGDAGRFHFAACLLLASRSDNRLPWDSSWIQRKLTSDVAPNLELWLQVGLITELLEDASIALATCGSSNDSVLERVEKRRERVEKKPFVRPSPEEVTGYGKEIGFYLDGGYFCDYYETRGWKTSSGPVKDWKACVRTWKANETKREAPNHERQLSL
jgi:hypothetical protein